MQPIFLILGSPAAGKSTISSALMQRFERGLHIPVDDLRCMVVSGLANVEAEPSAPLLEQIRLARASAASMARLYNAAGFAVVIDDFWHTQTPDWDYREILEGVHRILLLPSLEETLRRLYERGKEPAEVKPYLEVGVRHIHDAVREHPETTAGWHVIDSSVLDVEQTVERILKLTQIKP
jgi:predicted kinase